MRLTCPNCDAQYEVPDEVVPEAGRDVQCSNCGQTWFQHHPDHAPADEDDAQVEPDAPAPDEETSPPPPPVRHAEEAPQRRQLDPAVADILRQEAEAEHEARRKRQSEPLESQPDLGLDTADQPEDAAQANRRSLEAQERMARMRGEAAPGSDAAVAAVSSRRALLPDIEEINSTLRKDDDRSAGDAHVHGAVDNGLKSNRRRGFWLGFLVILAIATVLALVYTNAPKLAQMAPQTDPYLSSFVTWVDQTRVTLNGHVKNLLTWLESIASQSDG